MYPDKFSESIIWNLEKTCFFFVLCGCAQRNCPLRAALEFVESLNPVHSRLVSQA